MVFLPSNSTLFPRHHLARNPQNRDLFLHPNVMAVTVVMKCLRLLWPTSPATGRLDVHLPGLSVNLEFAPSNGIKRLQDKPCPAGFISPTKIFAKHVSDASQVMHHTVRKSSRRLTWMRISMYFGLLFQAASAAPKTLLSLFLSLRFVSLLSLFIQLRDASSASFDCLCHNLYCCELLRHSLF